MLSVGGTNSAALEKALMALLSKKEQQPPNNGQNRGAPGQENGDDVFNPDNFPGNFRGGLDEGASKGTGGARNSKRR